MKMSLVGIALATCALSACHVYQPLISHEINDKKVKDYQGGTCVGDLVVTHSLARACLKRAELEQGRSEHQYLNAVTTTVLVPAAGYIAFRAARQESSAPTAALAAGGLAAYATVGHLAPDGRIEAYSRGSKALTCAIGVYRVASTNAPRATIEKAAYEDALKASEERVVAAKKAGADVTKAEQQIRVVISAVAEGSATASLDAQLDQFVGQTIEDLNDLLRGTLPTLGSLSSEAATLSNATPAPPKQTARIGDDPYLLKDLYDSATALITAESAHRITADFSACQMSTAALAAQGLYKPLMLGPGNSAQGQVVDLKPGEAYTVPIVGGVAPLSDVIGGSDPADFRPTAEITMQGTALLKVTIGKQDKAAHTYRITIYDSAGGSRWIDVKVPAAS